MNQHWYHCHTCKMVDGIGVCSVCAKVCHADHDVTYSKYGSFFCDCGAKEDGSCQAMVKRLPQLIPSSSHDGSQQQSSSQSQVRIKGLRAVLFFKDHSDFFIVKLQ